VTDYISEGELFHKIKNFTRKLTQIYVAELALVIGKINSFSFQLHGSNSFSFYRISAQRRNNLSRSKKRKYFAR
jgi:hypothetical protein